MRNLQTAKLGPLLAVALGAACGESPAESIVMIHGTVDRFFSWDGDVAMLSMDSSVATWVEHNGCPAGPERDTLPDTADDGTLVRTERYVECTNGSEVMLFAVEGGGHTWPGAPFRLAGTGLLSREISASAELVTFFQRHVRDGS